MVLMLMSFAARILSDANYLAFQLASCFYYRTAWLQAEIAP